MKSRETAQPTEQTLIAVADELTREFCDLDQSIVIRAPCDCLRTDPSTSPEAIRREAYRVLVGQRTAGQR